MSQITLTKLTEELENLSQYSSDGVLNLSSHTHVWSLHFHRGKLLYVKGGEHPVRRWHRAIKQYCPNWNWRDIIPQSSKEQLWECKTLAQGIKEKQLSPLQAKLVIRAIAQESFFELSSYKDFQKNWQPSQKEISQLPPLVALSSWEILSVFTKAVSAKQKWQEIGLTHVSPNLVPTLKPGANQQTLPIEEIYCSGHYTLWDIASEQEQSVIEVALSLVPCLENSTLQFHTISDLPAPAFTQASDVSVPQIEKPSARLAHKLTLVQKKPLIACIDDSPVLAHTLKKILGSAGYQMLNIPEPMRGFSQLIEHQPDLILLDLLLPNADGYSICKFLRETPVFKTTPIIILTERNTPIDRAYAMEVGATAFLSKPPLPQELLQMVHQCLIQSGSIQN